MSAVTFSDSFSVGSVVVLFSLVLVGGVLLGQFRRGVVQELRASIATAQSELEIERGRSTRLETDVKALTETVAALKGENQALREMLVGGGHLQQAIVDSISDAVGHGTARVIEALQANRP